MGSPCSVFLVEPDAGRMLPIAVVDGGARELPLEEAFPRSIGVEHPIYAQAFRSRRPCVVHAEERSASLGVDSKIDPGLAAQGAAAMFIVPLVDGDSEETPLGIVTLLRRRSLPSEARDLSLLARLAAEGARSMTDPTASEESPARPPSEQRRLQSLVRALLRASSSVEVGEALLHAATDILGAAGAAVGCWSRDRSMTVIAR
jgi:hypothetical protein